MLELGTAKRPHEKKVGKKEKCSRSFLLSVMGRNLQDRANIRTRDDPLGSSIATGIFRLGASQPSWRVVFLRLWDSSQSSSRNRDGWREFSKLGRNWSEKLAKLAKPPACGVHTYVRRRERGRKPQKAASWRLACLPDGTW
jgi:hypothetical protein